MCPQFSIKTEASYFNTQSSSCRPLSAAVAGPVSTPTRFLPVRSLHSSPMCVAALTGCTHEQTSCVLNQQPSLSVPAVYLSKCLVGSRAERGKAPFAICFLLFLYITKHIFFVAVLTFDRQFVKLSPRVIRAVITHRLETVCVCVFGGCPCLFQIAVNLSIWPFLICLWSVLVHIREIDITKNIVLSITLC